MHALTYFEKNARTRPIVNTRPNPAARRARPERLRKLIFASGGRWSMLIFAGSMSHLCIWRAVINDQCIFQWQRHLCLLVWFVCNALLGSPLKTTWTRSLSYIQIFVANKRSKLFVRLTRFSFNRLTQSSSEMFASVSRTNIYVSCTYNDKTNLIHALSKR